MRPLFKLLFIVVLATGCTPQIRQADPVEVKIPLAVSCSMDEIQAPKWNIPLLAAGASTSDKLKAAFADLELSRGYIEQLQAELSACG